jgi:hypothetical protein
MKNEKAPWQGASSEVSGGGTSIIVTDRAALDHELREVLEAARLLASDGLVESCGDDIDLVGDLCGEVLQLVTAAVEALELDGDAAQAVLERALKAADRRLRERRALIAEWLAAGWLPPEVAAQLERGGVEPPPVATERLP